MSQPIATVAARDILIFLMDQGVKPPESYSRPRGVDAAAESYARLLTVAGVTVAEAQEAAAAYVMAFDDTRFPTPWPSVGKIIAHTPTARRVAHFGGDLDVGEAWADFTQRWRGLSRYATHAEHAAAFKQPDSHQEAAMRFAIEETGGMSAWFNHLPADAPHIERRWRDAYRAARKGQAHDPEVVKQIATAERLLTVKR
jgi:hypothetical protein